MNEEDPDLLAGDNLDKLRGRGRYSPMSERFRLTELLENARYQNNLLVQKCRELEKERDEADLHPERVGRAPGVDVGGDIRPDHERSPGPLAPADRLLRRVRRAAR